MRTEIWKCVDGYAVMAVSTDGAAFVEIDSAATERVAVARARQLARENGWACAA